jgi:hypothetical protein
MYEFFLFNINELLIRITERSIKTFNDLDCSIYQSYYKIFPNFSHLKRYMVVILTK